MLVKDSMTRHPIMVAPSVRATEAQRIMTENKVHHLPVVGDGKRLIGLVTRSRLALKGDAMGSLNVWEISRYISDLSVKELMHPRKRVQVVAPDCTIEYAARMMTDHRIGCLPVVEDADVVVGIITEVDVMMAFQEMMGLPFAGVRVTMRMSDQPGEFNKLMLIVAEQGWGVMGVGSFHTPRRQNSYDLVLKLPHVTLEEVRSALAQVENQEIVDIRTVD